MIQGNESSFTPKDFPFGVSCPYYILVLSDPWQITMHRDGSVEYKPHGPGGWKVHLNLPHIKLPSADLFCADRFVNIFGCVSIF